MTPKPVAIGLLLCDRVIVDKDTNSPSAIGIFTGLAVESFPSDSQRFSVLAVLTDAQGEGRGKIAVYRLDEHWLRQEEIYATEHTVRFPDRFAVVNFNLRVRTIRFPAPASYEFVMFVDNDKVAHRRMRVYQAPPGSFLSRRSSMRNSQEFDYDQPTRDALAGIYVEVSDSAAENPSAESNGASVPQLEKLFGLTVTVDDQTAGESSSRTR